MKIDMERYNKSAMPENADNAEKYFYDPPGIRTHDLGNTGNIFQHFPAVLGGVAEVVSSNPRWVIKIFFSIFRHS